MGHRPPQSRGTPPPPRRHRQRRRNLPYQQLARHHARRHRRRPPPRPPNDRPKVSRRTGATEGRKPSADLTLRHLLLQYAPGALGLPDDEPYRAPRDSEEQRMAQEPVGETEE